MRRGGAVAAALGLAFVLAGCGGDGDGTDAAPPELTVFGAYVPRPPTAEVAGAFLTVENRGGTDDALVSVTSDAAGSVEIHETEGNAMREVSSLTVPAGGSLSLDRGGDHLMLMDLRARPAEGDTIPIELHFRTSAPIALDVPVEAANHTGE